MFIAAMLFYPYSNDAAVAVTPRMPIVGRTSRDFEQLRSSVNNWIFTEGLSYRVKRSDAKRCILVCRDSARCTFQLLAHSRDDGWQITTFSRHVCPISTHKNFAYAIRRNYSQSIIMGA